MITSSKNETIKEIIKLKQKKYRDEMNLFLIEGYHLVEEAIKYGYVKTIITTLEESFEQETIYVSKEVMNKIAFTKTPQPIMAVCYKKINQSVDYHQTRYLLLDRLQDPGNIGTILRSALAFGFHHIIISNDSVDLYNDKVIRATQGALFHLNITIANLKEEIEKLKENQVQVYATSLRNAKSIEEYHNQEKMAFVMGNEGQGVSHEIIDICDGSIYIPIQQIESLNVGVASAIIMYQFKK
jgi:TrmH family RNA methyltransferase